MDSPDRAESDKSVFRKRIQIYPIQPMLRLEPTISMDSIRTQHST